MAAPESQPQLSQQPYWFPLPHRSLSFVSMQQRSKFHRACSLWCSLTARLSSAEDGCRAGLRPAAGARLQPDRGPAAGKPPPSAAASSAFPTRGRSPPRPKPGAELRGPWEGARPRSAEEGRDAATRWPGPAEPRAGSSAAATGPAPLPGARPGAAPHAPVTWQRGPGRSR